jgi:transcription termination/antitermination protein NusG
MTPDDEQNPPADTPDAQPAAETATEHPPADEQPAAESAEAAAPPEPAPAGPANGAPPAEAPPSNKKWYIIKVTSGREESIKAAIERRVKIEGLEEFFGQIYIPVERVTEIKKVKETKNGEKVTKEKRVTKERKKFPGYIMAEVEFNDRILYLFRETSGVGDFVGAGGPGKPPPPMTDIEVKRMLGEAVPEDPTKAGQKIKVKLDFEKGDKVRIREGAFSNMEGEVKEITEPKEAGETPKVTVEVQIFGRPVGVELDYWQVDKV